MPSIVSEPKKFVERQQIFSLNFPSVHVLCRRIPFPLLLNNHFFRAGRRSPVLDPRRALSIEAGSGFSPDSSAVSGSQQKIGAKDAACPRRRRSSPGVKVARRAVPPRGSRPARPAAFGQHQPQAAHQPRRSPDRGGHSILTFRYFDLSLRNDTADIMSASPARPISISTSVSLPPPIFATIVRHHPAVR